MVRRGKLARVTSITWREGGGVCVGRGGKEDMHYAESRHK